MLAVGTNQLVLNRHSLQVAPPAGRDDRLYIVWSHPQVYVLDTAHARQSHAQDAQGEGQSEARCHCG